MFDGSIKKDDGISDDLNNDWERERGVFGYEGWAHVDGCMKWHGIMDSCASRRSRQATRGWAVSRENEC